MVVEYTRLAGGFPGAFVERCRAASAGAELVIDEAVLGRALIAVKHPRWRDFCWDRESSNHRRRLWLLDANDVLSVLPEGLC